MDAAILVKAIYHYLSPKTFLEQQVADDQVFSYLNLFGVSVTREKLEPRTILMDDQEKALLGLLAEAGSYPARLTLNKQAFWGKQTSKFFAKKQQIFNTLREAATVSVGYAAMGQLRIKRHAFKMMHHNATVQKTMMQKRHGEYRQKLVFRAWHGVMVENRLAARLNRLQSLYQKRCQLAEKELLKKSFLDFRKSVNATYSARVKASFLLSLATTGFTVNTQTALQDIYQQYKKFLKKTLPQIHVLKDLDAFVVNQLPAIAFVQDAFKEDLSETVLMNKNIRFLPPSTLDRLNTVLNKNKKIEKRLCLEYWSPATAATLKIRIKELETHAQRKSGLVDRFCEVFYSLEAKHQNAYIMQFASEKQFSWASPILKHLFLHDPACFIASFFEAVSPAVLERFLMPESDHVLDEIYHRLQASFGDENIRALHNREFAQLYIIDLRFQSGTTPRALLDRFGASLLALIDRSEFQNTPVCIAIQKEQSTALKQTTLRKLQGAAILLLCFSGYLYKYTAHKQAAIFLGLYALFCINKAFRYDIG